MSLIYNGTTIKKLIYNGTEMKKMNYNGVEVYSSLDPTKSSFTEEEFIAVVNATLQAKMTIGAKVALTNTYCSSYSVIGVNHDSTTNTVDLYCDSCCNNSITYGSQDWSGSTRRTWLNGTYYNAFTNVMSLIKTMTVTTSGSNTSDKVKLLSGTEIGASHSYMSSNEGAKYEAFSSHSGGTSGFSDAWRGTADGNWLRSYSQSGTYRTVWRNVNGNLTYIGGVSYAGIAGVLRF